jgi:hypothetical protein
VMIGRSAADAREAKVKIAIRLRFICHARSPGSI